MSVENGDGSSTTEVYEAVDEARKKPKILYTRDFLLSLSEMEICKELPSGFDQSILSEFEAASHGIQDRPRVYSGLPFHRNDYSSSPPTRGDSSNLSRGVYGRRDNRASGRSDKDGNSQSDLDSAGTSAPKIQTNEHHQLNRSNLPYQPPRPFKVVPHSRTSTNDSFNDETFGSSDCTSQDKAEEERKRRASFELMRREQQKVLQEKQKLNANKHISDCFTDLMSEEAKEKDPPETNGEPDSASLFISNNDSGKASFPSQSSTSRPLVPPGFRSTVVDKNSTEKPLNSSTDKEGNPAHPKNENSFGHKIGEEAIMSSSLGLKVPTAKIATGRRLHEAVDVEGFEHLTNKVTLGNKTVSNSGEDSTPFILGKLFGNAPTNKNVGSSGFIEPHENKPDDSASTRDAQSSKFSQWFHKDVLTCEDLEQTILSEYSDKTLLPHPPVPDWTISGQENTPTVDNHATNHLLSLLQKGTSDENTLIPSNINIGSLDKHPKDGVISTFDNPKDAGAGNLPNSGPNLTLETLFGTDFMKELQSDAGFARTDPVMDNGIEPVSDKVESWFQFDGAPVNDRKSLKKPGNRTEIRLPEKESLFPVGDSDATIEIAEKLAALNSGFRGERVVRGPYDISNPERQFNCFTQMTRNQTMFNQLDPRSVHINAHTRFSDHQFPANMLPFNHPDTRVTGFNIPANRQMQMPGNFPHHLLRDFPRPLPVSVSPNPSNQAAANFMPTAGLRMPLPASDPEESQRMMEMEAKRLQPFGNEMDMGFQYR